MTTTTKSVGLDNPRHSSSAHARRINTTPASPMPTQLTRAQQIAELRTFASTSKDMKTVARAFLETNLLGNAPAVGNARRGRDLLEQAAQHFHAAADMLERMEDS